MNIALFTINSFGLIPVTQHIIQCFVEEGITVKVVECTIGGVDSSPTVTEKVTLSRFKSYREFAKQSKLQKTRKYLRLFRALLSSYSARDVLYILDYQILFFALILNSAFRRNQIIYHQFELVENRQLGKATGILWRFITKNSKLLNLAVFPERKRAEYFISKSTVNPKNVLVFANSCKGPQQSFSELPELIREISFEKIICAHIGNVGLDHYLDFFLQYIEASIDQDIFFLMVGRYDDKVLDKIGSISNPNFIFCDAIPHSEILKVYPHIDCGFILYKGVDLNFEYCAPNKLYEYLAHGVKVIAHPLTGLRALNLPSEILQLVDMNEFASFASLQPKKLNEDKITISRYFDSNLSIEIELCKIRERLRFLQ